MLTTGQISDIMYQLFVYSVQLGIIISILQAATQIHEQTLTFVPKLIVIGIILLLTGSTMLKTLQNFTEEIFALIAG